MDVSPVDLHRARILSGVIPGWSTWTHYAFFHHLFRHCDVRNLLILGVYHGRDIVFMMNAAKQLGCEGLRITGVDKFRDEAAEDWPPENRGRTWKDVGLRHAPNFELARDHIARFNPGIPVTLIRERDEIFLRDCTDRYDFIYVDAAHDYNTVARQIRQAIRILTEDGLLAGDDYSDRGTWGVKRAVNEFAPNHFVYGTWIWLTARDHVRMSQALDAHASGEG